MAANSFGNLFRMTTWGESHGPAIGVVVDGMPAGIPINIDRIQSDLDRRRPGRHTSVSPRDEADRVEVLSGVFEGISTGHPISMCIRNHAADDKPYLVNQKKIKPGHAQFSYQEKYGVFDFRGGGRASARETACRVAAGALAKQLLDTCQIQCMAFLEQLGSKQIQIESQEITREKIACSPLFCPDEAMSRIFINDIEALKASGDSTGGVVGFMISGVPCGLGDPVYEKLDARLAFAMMSLPASKGFEIGFGFESAAMRGSAHNDGFKLDKGVIKPATNHAGGLLGGISTGELIRGRVAFKPTSSIKLEQITVTTDKAMTIYQEAQGAKHDPCVAIRAVPVVEAMCCMVIADAYLMNRTIRL